MRDFIKKTEDMIAAVLGKIMRRLSRPEKEQGEDTPPKKQGLFERADAFLARYDGSFLIWSFFLSAALMLLIYVAMDVYPFGRSSVLVLDLYAQYVQFFNAFRAFLFGDASLLYSFSRSLGGEFLGIYAYYLASPLSFIVALFPKEGILEALLVMFVLKSGLTGLHFGIFLHYTRRPPKMMTIALSILYALSSYGIVMQHNTMWMDAMMLLPLLLLGLERLVQRKGPFLYTITLALVLLSNYYIGYMMCIFTAMYYFYYLLAHEKDIKNPTSERHHFLSSLLRMGVFTLLGIGIAALLLLPAYYSLTFGKTDFSDPNFALTTKFDLIDFIAKLFPGAYDTVRPEGLPWVYSGALSLLLVPLYFSAKKIPSRERIASAILLLLIFLSMYLNPLDMLWHGGQAPNWLNYRYSFVFAFVVLLLGARVLSVLKSVDPRILLAISAFLFVLIVVLQKLGLTYTSNGVTKEYFDDLSGVWLSIGCLVLYSVLLLFLGGHDRTSPRYEPIATLLIAVLCVEVLLNGVFYLRRQNEDVVITSYDTYHGFYDVYEDAFDYVKETDDSLFYRMDKSFQFSVCDAFVFGYRGLASSTSTLNADVVKLQDLLGMKANSHWTEATGATIVTNSLFGVKYWVTREGDPVDPRYVEYHRDGTAEAGNKTVTYQNAYALPLAFAASGGVGALDLTAATGDGAMHSPFERMNAIYSALTGDDSLSVYQPINAGMTTKNGMYRTANADGHCSFSCTEGDEAARIVFTFYAPEDGTPVYCYFPSYYPREASLYLNGTPIEVLYPGCAKLAPIVMLGTFAPGEVVTVELSIGKYGNFWLVDETPYFYTVDEGALASATATLSRGGLSLSESKEHAFAGTLTASKGFTTVQTTIPYDAGWQIRVNGEKVEGYETLSALLAFDLPEAGTYEITLSYWPPIYTVGICLSAGAALITGALLALAILWRRGRISLEGKGIFSRTLLFFLPTEGTDKKAPRK